MRTDETLAGMGEDEARLYLAMLTLWERGQRGERVDPQAVREAEEAWVQAAATRVGKVGVKRKART
jgi:hypothetical protein